MVVHLFVAWRCQLALSHQNTCARKHTQTTWVVVNEQPAIDPGALRFLDPQICWVHDGLPKGVFCPQKQGMLPF